jgi:Fe2+ transport system protein FeoA
MRLSSVENIDNQQRRSGQNALLGGGGYPILFTVKQEPSPTQIVLAEGQCLGAEWCPLSSVEAGTTVCIKQLAASPDMIDRLRELGFCEEQKIKLLSRQSSLICQVCNARLGISEKLAQTIIVEHVSGAARGRS